MFTSVFNQANMKISIYLLLFCCLFSASGLQATSVQASSFGFNATNATQAFETAIYSEFDTVIVDLQLADWNIGPLVFFDLLNKTIIFERGVVLKAIAGAYPQTGDCLFSLKDCSFVTIIGYQATFQMNKPEYAALNDSEYRHCLSLWNCNAIKVLGLTLKDSGGDGIYIGGENAEGNPGYCSNIYLEDLSCINNYRQGMSVISVMSLTVKNCLFTQTSGTLPEAGVDIEPYEIYHKLTDITFDQCTFTHNNWSGIAVALTYMDSTSMPIDILFKDCYLSQNRVPENTYAACEIYIGANYASPVGGQLTFERCMIDRSEWTALYSRKTAEAFHTTFRDCVFQNVSMQQIEYNEPVFFEVPDYEIESPSLGGYTFDKVLISYPTDFNFLRVYGWSTLEGISDIDGVFTVVEPNGNGVLYSNVTLQENITYTYSTQATLPPTTLEASIIQSEAIECIDSPALISFQRSSADITYPLPVNHDYFGSAGVAIGDDIHILPNGLIIAANTSQAELNIEARNDLISEDTEEVFFIVQDNLLYTNFITEYLPVDLKDCFDFVAEQKEYNPFLIYPSPAYSTLSINTNEQSGIYWLINSLGAKVHAFALKQGGNAIIDIGFLSPGLYFIQDAKGSNKGRFIKE
jgi:Right handed beta helix region